VWHALHFYFYGDIGPVSHLQALKKVVGVDKMDMFQMTKLLSSHMKSKTDIV
jgi:hypothetical protein